MIIFVFFYLIIQFGNAWVLYKFINTIDHYQITKKISQTAKIGLISVLSLNIGDLIHFIYLLLAYIKVDLWLNGFSPISLLITTVSMTSYYAGLVFFVSKEYEEKQILPMYWGLLFIYVVRIVFAVLPGNNYAIEGPATAIRIISNIIFCIFGCGILSLFYLKAKTRNSLSDIYYKKVVIWGFISFFFYILHLILYPINAAFGMLMLAKSTAYVFEVFYLVKGIKVSIKAPKPKILNSVNIVQ